MVDTRAEAGEGHCMSAVGSDRPSLVPAVHSGQCIAVVDQDRSSLVSAVQAGECTPVQQFVHLRVVHLYSCFLRTL